MLEIRPGDVSAADVCALVAEHLAGMHAQSPACSVHALDLSSLTAPGVHFVTAYRDGELVGMGAIATLPDGDVELKSMRTTDAARGTGAGRAILVHLMDLARTSGAAHMWLETGSSDDFTPARTLYASAGFTECAPFADYAPDPLSTFMTRPL